MYGGVWFERSCPLMVGFEFCHVECATLYIPANKKRIQNLLREYPQRSDKKMSEL